MNDRDLIKRRQQTLGPTYRKFFDQPLLFSKTDANRSLEAIDISLHQFQA